MLKELGRRAKQRRVLLGITQEDLALAVGRSHGWVSALEAGDSNPPAEVITALAVALGERPEDYLQLAGRAVLRAENVVPATRMITLTEAELEALLTRAAETAVRRGLRRPTRPHRMRTRRAALSMASVSSRSSWSLWSCSIGIPTMRSGPDVGPSTLESQTTPDSSGVTEGARTHR